LAVARIGLQWGTAATGETAMFPAPIPDRTSGPQLDRLHDDRIVMGQVGSTFGGREAMLKLRRTSVVTEDKRQEAGRDAEIPLRKIAIIAVVENPFAARYVEDLTSLIEASVALGEGMAGAALKTLHPYTAQSYGKAGLVSLAGEQEHANALPTTVFADPFRRAIGGCQAWISSMMKIAAPGTLIDVPMNHRDETLRPPTF
jgi:hypothetical protein